MKGTTLRAGAPACQPRALNRAKCSSCRPRIGRVPIRAAPVSLDDLMLDVPDIDGDLRSVQAELGATFDDKGVVLTFGNGDKALDALEAGVVLMDRTHWGRLRVVGEGRQLFLHNQSTNDFTRAAPGQGYDTVFVTATARTIDLATALILEQGVLLLTHPSTRHPLLTRLQKYIFPADKVEIQDISSKTSMFTLLGPESDAVLKELGAGSLSGAARGSHTLLKLKDRPVIAIAHTGLTTPGYTFIVDETIAADLYSAFAAKGAVLMGEEEWQRARILEGRPEPGVELTDEYNPLEAGLYGVVSVSKGCYIGQETLAKLANLDAVKQQLWGLRLGASCSAGDEITSGGKRVGRVTSVTTDLNGRPFALGYIRCKASGAQVQLEGAIVKVNGSPAVVASLPFATRSFREGAGPLGRGVGESAAQEGAAAAGSIQAAADEAKRLKAEQEAVEAAEKEARLQAMQERLAAWQAQQKQQKQQQQQ